MTKRAELLALAEQVEQGKRGPEFNQWLCEYLGVHWSQASCDFDGVWSCKWPQLTDSIDAQAALPGRIFSVTNATDGWHAYAISGSGMCKRSGRAPTEPAARLAALLRCAGESA